MVVQYRHKARLLLLPAGSMAAEGESVRPMVQGPPSGPGQVRLLAKQAALALATGEPSSAAAKAASLHQLSVILVLACAKSEFPTVNRHLHVDELAGLGWVDLQPLHADLAKGAEALAASIATLVCTASPSAAKSACKPSPHV